MDATLAFQTLSPEQMLDAVEGCDIRCDGRFLALNSYENRVYRIGVEDGPPIVVKFYRPNRWSREAILEEHRFTQELSENEVPVIAPLAKEDGDTLYESKGFLFALYPCQGGRAPELDNPDHLEMLGRFIGRIHAIGGADSYHHRPDISIDSYVLSPSKYLLENRFIPDHLCEAWSTLIEALVAQMQACIERAGQIPLIRLHGDFHHGNVLWTDDGPHIVDFDDARTGPAIQDIWMFLSGDRSYMTARLGDILEGYTQFYDFDPAELHLVEVLRTLRLIHHCGWLAGRWQDPAFPQAFPWFNTLQYWEQQVLNLREQQVLLNEPPLNWPLN